MTHPITPPPELVQQWLGEFFGCMVSGELSDSERFLTTRAAQWGADQELEACCEWLHWQNLATHPELIPSLRAARRPKAPSLKEQALEALETLNQMWTMPKELDAVITIRRALEQLSDD